MYIDFTYLLPPCLFPLLYLHFPFLHPSQLQLVFSVLSPFPFVSYSTPFSFPFLFNYIYTVYFPLPPLSLLIFPLHFSQFTFPTLFLFLSLSLLIYLLSVPFSLVLFPSHSSSLLLLFNFPFCFSFPVSLPFLPPLTFHTMLHEVTWGQKRSDKVIGGSREVT